MFSLLLVVEGMDLIGNRNQMFSIGSLLLDVPAHLMDYRQNLVVADRAMGDSMVWPCWRIVLVERKPP